MPQMYPMNWIILFLFFIIIFSFSLNKFFFTPHLSFSHSLNQNLLTNNNNIWMW